MRKKGIKRDNEIFKCTLIANLSLRMSKLEREKKEKERERVAKRPGEKGGNEGGKG